MILWDHGGGSISGYGYDLNYANSGSMTLDKINTAIKDGGCTFDFVGFDACLMATLETALMLEPYSDYLIASNQSQTTLSVMDLAEIKGTVPAAFKDFSESTLKLLSSDNYQTVSTARSNVKEFAQSVEV